MLGLTIGSPASFKSHAFFGLKAAFFHASAICEQKWAARFRKTGYGCSNGYKEYNNYLKRKRRAVAKRDLLRWRTCEIFIRNFDELFWSHRPWKFSKQQHEQDHSRRYQTKGAQEHTEHFRRKKQKKHGQANPCGHDGQESPNEESRKDPFHNFWQRVNNSYSEWWGFSSFSSDDFRFSDQHPFSDEGKSQFSEEWKSYTRSSCYNESTNKTKVKPEPTIGLPADRRTLGLSPSGSLTMEELKKAFRTSALKWHPDRHDGAAKATAEAKFKDCGAAYKSLLNALARA